MQLIESIRTCNRRLENIDRHNDRFNHSRSALFGLEEKIDLRKFITIPSHLGPGVYKCRVLYGPTIQRIEFQPYRPKTVNSFALVTANDLEYHHKYTDRRHLQELLAQSPADEIIIVKNGYLTDASYANLCFFEGEKWLTPSTPLLPGTMRAKLLDKGTIQAADIKPTDLRFFKKIKLINAMLVFENTSAVDIRKLRN